MSDLIEQLLDKPGDIIAGLPDWLQQQRDEAERLSANASLPTRKLESWKYTSLKPMQALRFTHEAGEDAALCSEDLADLMIPGLDCHALVFVNGQFRPQLSLLEELPDAVTITSLGGDTAGDFVPFAESFLVPDPDPAAVFDNINLSRFTDGLLIDIPAGVTVRKPLFCLYLNISSESDSAQHYRHQIRIGEGARLTLIEQQCSEGSAAAAVTQVSELKCDADAELSHVKIRRMHEQGYLLDTTRVCQQSSSRYNCWTFDLHGRLIRHACRIDLAGDSASCDLKGLYIPNQQEQNDTQLLIDHQKRDCSSAQHFRGVVSDRSRAVFRGKVIVQPGADGADAAQHNANLLLSDQAEVDTRPELEIHADEVQCSHGATVGQLDDNQLFYLQSRGISQERARVMMMAAFCQQIADSLDSDPLRSYLTGMINEQFSS